VDSNAAQAPATRHQPAVKSNRSARGIPSGSSMSRGASRAIDAIDRLPKHTPANDVAVWRLAGLLQLALRKTPPGQLESGVLMFARKM